MVAIQGQVTMIGDPYAREVFDGLSSLRVDEAHLANEDYDEGGVSLEFVALSSESSLAAFLGNITISLYYAADVNGHLGSAAEPVSVAVSVLDGKGINTYQPFARFTQAYRHTEQAFLAAHLASSPERGSISFCATPDQIRAVGQLANRLAGPWFETQKSA